MIVGSRNTCLHYTNAATLIQEGFQDTEDLDGLFSGFDPETGVYDVGERTLGLRGLAPTTTVRNAAEEHQAGPAVAGEPPEHSKGVHGYAIDGGARAHRRSRSDMTTEPHGRPLRDPTLQHPRCVFQILKRHFSRYTPEIVSQVCGCSPEEMVRVAELLCANSGRDRTSVMVYALGWTQHAAGAQMIRAGGIMQLLLGNIGRPGGGILAMRGHSSIQGSTDVATLYDFLPGYLPQPGADAGHETLDSYVAHEGQTAGYWSHFREYIVSLLKAWYGDAATARERLPFRLAAAHRARPFQLPTFNRMSRGEVKGYFLFGQNPGGGGLNAGLHRAGLRNLEWLVVLDWFETESAVFWKSDPGGPPPSDIKTEVFFIPAAAESGDGRHPDQHATAAPVAHQGDRSARRLPLRFLVPLQPRQAAQAAVRRLDRSQGSAAARISPGTTTTTNGHGFPMARSAASRTTWTLEKILMEMNGYKLDEIDPRTGQPRLLTGFSELKDDGTTACGCWIYSGVIPEPGRNRARERRRSDNPLEPDWGFAWPDNRRVLFNRASADPEGRPWSERKKLVWWDAERRLWVGLDRPDFEPDKPPDYRPAPGATGMAAIAGDNPFIMKPDGVAWLFAPSGVKDGPLPTHYEPARVAGWQFALPQADIDARRCASFPGPLNRLVHAPETEYPVVATTYRLTEHYLSGPMSRFNSWLNELQPEMFVELSPELAAERGIVHGGWMTVSSARGRIEARAMVTRRMRPLAVEGRVIHQVGIPFHWGFAGQVVGGNANDLTSLVAEQNVSMHEGKGLRLPGRGRPRRRTHAAADGAIRDLAHARAHSRHAGRRPSRKGEFTHGH